MKADERDMLLRLSERMERLEVDVADVLELKRAFMELPIGAQPGERTLLVNLKRMVIRDQRWAWLGRMSTVTAPTLVGVLLFWKDIGDFFANFIPDPPDE